MRRLAITIGLLVLAVLPGLLLDLERAESWLLWGLMGALLGVSLAVAMYFIADSDKYEKTIWRDWSGRIVNETPWRYVGQSAPIDREDNVGVIGCLVVMPLLFVTVCLVIGSVANISSYLTGYPERYADQVLNALALGIPDESARATHPSGFSMVMPGGWSVEAVGEYLIASSVGRPYEAKFLASECSTHEAADGLTGTFQGKPARLEWNPGSADRHRLVKIGNGEQRITLLTEGKIFCLTFRAPNFDSYRGPIRSERSAEIDRYFETFRYDPPRELVGGEPTKSEGE